MTTKVTIDSAGRVIIPKPVRDALGLGAGDTLALEVGTDAVTLRPARAPARLGKEKGVWVFRSGAKISAEETERLLSDQRARRDR